jgi:hypothetical protein
LIEYGGGPADWVTRHGAPARCLGNLRGHGGMPSFEDDEGNFVVFDFVVAAVAVDGTMMAISKVYGGISIIYPEGLAPAVRAGKAMYRPLIYRRHALYWWQRLGSQMELAWRYGLGAMLTAMQGIEDGEDFDPAKDFTMAKADERADHILSEFLTPLQKIELRANAKFRVIGGKTGNLYMIEEANGFAQVDEVTGDTLTSYCLHPDYWMPNADVALATKFHLEDEDMELETIKNARATPYPREKIPTWEEVAASKIEKELMV